MNQNINHYNRNWTLHNGYYTYQDKFEKNEIKEAEVDALIAIDSLENLVNEIKIGYHEGRLWSKLVDKDPIQFALDAINKARDLRIHYFPNKKIDKLYYQRFQDIVNDLANFLKENEEHPEIKNVIQAINNKDTPSLKIIFSSINSLPDVLCLIFGKMRIDELGQAMLVSKKFNEYANDQEIWKNIFFKRNPSFLEIYPGVKEKHFKMIDWKHLNKLDDLEMLKEKFNPNVEIKVEVPYDVVPFENEFYIRSFNIKVKIDSDKLTLKNFRRIIAELLGINYKFDFTMFCTSWSSSLEIKQSEFSDHMTLKELIGSGKNVKKSYNKLMDVYNITQEFITVKSLVFNKKESVNENNNCIIS